MAASLKPPLSALLARRRVVRYIGAGHSLFDATAVWDGRCQSNEARMHPIIPLAALSWTIVLSLAAITHNAISITLGALPYRDGAPTVALAFLCLAVAIDALVRAMRRQ